MKHENADLLKRREPNQLDRRKAIQLLAVGATASLAASAGAEQLTTLARFPLPANSAAPFRAVAFNHINYQVGDYAKVRNFYVEMFGMKPVWDDGRQCSVEFGDPPNAIYIRPLTRPLNRPSGTGTAMNWSEEMGHGNIDHLALSIDNFELESVKNELARRGLNPRQDGPYAWTVVDPSGYTLQICAVRGVFPGQASPTAKESAGLKNLNSDPKPDGKGFQAYAVSHIEFMVPDVEKSRDFYTGLLGMNAIYYKPADKTGSGDAGGAVCFLRFGQNTMCLRQSRHPENKPYVSFLGFVTQKYDRAKVKSELQQQGYKPEPDTKFGWAIRDPEGMKVGLAGKGWAEDVIRNCGGDISKCPSAAGT